MKVKITKGTELLQIARTAEHKQPRDTVSLMADSIIDNRGFKAIAIFGRRATGKTVFVRHLILELHKRGISTRDLYIVNIWSSNGKNMEDLYKITSRLKNKIIIIEDITKLDNFSTVDSTKFKNLTTHNYVIMTGCNTYAFKESKLYDIISVNNIGYREYIRILDEELKGLDNSSKINHYLEWGILRDKAGTDKLSADQVYSTILCEIVLVVKNNIGFEEVDEHIKRVNQQDADKSVYTIL